MSLAFARVASGTYIRTRSATSRGIGRGTGSGQGTLREEASPRRAVRHSRSPAYVQRPTRIPPMRSHGFFKDTLASKSATTTSTTFRTDYHFRLRQNATDCNEPRSR